MSWILCVLLSHAKIENLTASKRYCCPITCQTFWFVSLSVPKTGTDHRRNQTSSHCSPPVKVCSSKVKHQMPFRCARLRFLLHRATEARRKSFHKIGPFAFRLCLHKASLTGHLQHSNKGSESCQSLVLKPQKSSSSRIKEMPSWSWDQSVTFCVSIPRHLRTGAGWTPCAACNSEQEISICMLIYDGNDLQINFQSSCIWYCAGRQKQISHDGTGGTPSKRNKYA